MSSGSGAGSGGAGKRLSSIHQHATVLGDFGAVNELDLGLSDDEQDEILLMDQSNRGDSNGNGSESARSSRLELPFTNNSGQTRQRRVSSIGVAEGQWDLSGSTHVEMDHSTGMVTRASPRESTRAMGPSPRPAQRQSPRQSARLPPPAASSPQNSGCSDGYGSGGQFANSGSSGSPMQDDAERMVSEDAPAAAQSPVSGGDVQLDVHDISDGEYTSNVSHYDASARNQLEMAPIVKGGDEGKSDAPSNFAAAMDDVRDAYAKGDSEKSRQAHIQKSMVGCEEDHGGTGSEYVKSIIYGGLDGIITTFAVVAAASGAGLSIEVMLVMGIASLIADGISMGVGDALSERAELDYALREQDRENWELENYPEGERQEMVDFYITKGMTKEDAQTIVHAYAKYKELFVDLMLVFEIGVMPPDPDDSPWKNGMWTFGSFLLFGSLPLIPYILFYAFDWDGDDGETWRFIISCAATAVTLFVLGYAKSKIIKGESAMKSGFWMLVNGTFAAAAAYLSGLGLEHAFNLSDVCT